jgi:DNA-binding MarR family transcriptional regulator
MVCFTNTCNGRVAEFVNRLGRAAHCLQFEQGLNPAQWETLRYLARANRYSRSPTAIAEFLGTTKGTVSQTIRALEAKGYLRRSKDCSDGRAICLEVTDAGCAVLEQDPIKRLEQAVAALPPETSKVMLSGLRALMGKLQDNCGGRAFGLCGECGHLREGEEACGSTTADNQTQCGLNGDPLNDADKAQICVNFRAAAR